jgi:hypothetical protein
MKGLDRASSGGVGFVGAAEVGEDVVERRVGFQLEPFQALGFRDGDDRDFGVGFPLIRAGRLARTRGLRVRPPGGPRSVRSTGAVWPRAGVSPLKRPVPARFSLRDRAPAPNETKGSLAYEVDHTNSSSRGADNARP